MTNLYKIAGVNYECTPQQWDTDYFGVNSARVNLSGIVDALEQDKIIEFCGRYEFTTISNLNNTKENNHWIGKRTNAFLTDINIQFRKELKDTLGGVDEHTEVFNHLKKQEKIIDIARASFIFSRFFNDPKLPKIKASNIYAYWTEGAFEKENKYFVICRRDGQIAGYILFSMNTENQTSTIELIAVDEKFRGQRVGKSLLQALESYSAERSIKTIKVGTQVDNIAAAQFYHSAGYKYVSCGSVYHLWK